VVSYLFHDYFGAVFGEKSFFLAFRMTAFFTVGCYTKAPYVPEPEKYSIFIVKLEASKDFGKLSIISKYDDIFNASYFSKSGNRLFVVSEDQETSSIVQYRIRRFDARSIDSGKIEQTPLLELEKKVEFDDGGACYVSVEELIDESKRISVACYDSGVLRCFRSDGRTLKEEGKVKFEYCTDEQSERQESPHAHCVVKIDDEEGSLAVVDLGADRVYRVKASTYSPSIVPDAHFAAPTGSGPRHLLLHPTKPLSFLLLELSNELLVLSKDLSKIIQKISLLNPPADTVNDPSCEIQAAAHLAISDNGEFVLCSNRGKVNNVIVFEISGKGEQLEFVDFVETGSFPRYFELIEDQFLVIANQKSNNLMVHHFDKGKIDKTPVATLDLPSPVCIQIL